MSNPLNEQTKQMQQSLAAYCRTGIDEPVEGVTPERVPEYRRLVFNVVRTALTSTYPLTENLLTTKEWAKLIQQFFEQHDCQHPQVWRMPKELIGFVEHHKEELQSKHPHILDLLSLEWLEVELYMMPDKPQPKEKSNDFWDEPWVWNPEHELRQFEFPVHTKNARFISTTDRGSHWCLAFRKADKSSVRFFNLSPLLALFASHSIENGVSPKAFLLTQTDLEVSLEAAMPVFEKLFLKLKEDGAIY